MKLVGSKCELVLIPNTIKYLWLRYSVSCKLSNIYQFNLSISLLAITCSKLTIETLEQDVKYIRS